MSWMQQLIATYDDYQVQENVSDPKDSRDELPPVGHLLASANIELTIDAQGNFVHARALSRNEARTLIPCTLDFASRTSTHLAPHPLHDNLAYVARDYGIYEPTKKKGAYNLYVKNLKEWCESELCTPAVRAVYLYVTRNDMIQDLLREKVIYEEAPGKILEKWDVKERHEAKPLLYQNTQAGNILKSFVRFRVIGTNARPELWLDKELREVWQKYFAKQHEGERALCYATGRMVLPMANHSKGIRYPGDNAKLISSNDTDGFTFRGRFSKAEECLTVSYEASQKAFNTLSWLISHQGYLVGKRKPMGERVFLVWGRMEAKVPAIETSTRQLLFGKGKRTEKARQLSTMKTWADALRKAMHGYRHEFKKRPGSQVNVMILDAATKGRMAICYYDEVAGKDFIDRLEKWHLHGMWQQHDYDEEKGKTYAFSGVPSIGKLIQACFGRAHSSATRIKSKQEDEAEYGTESGNTKFRLETERLFTAIEQGRDLPIEFLTRGLCMVVKQAAVRTKREKQTRSRSGKRLTTEKERPLEARLRWKYDYLEPVCSIARYHFYHQQEDYDMALNESSTNRSYLYGRLLALADKLELATYSKEEQKTRQTNAMRYMNIFSDRPYTTWQLLQKKLLPYEHRRELYGGKERKLIHEVGDMFKEEDFASDEPLDGRFLLGFYSQEYVIEQEIAKRKQDKAEKEAKEAMDEEDI